MTNCQYYKRDAIEINLLAESLRDKILEENVSKAFSLTGVNITPDVTFLPYLTLHKKWSFQLRISSVNVTESGGICDLVTFTEEILNGKLYFLAVLKNRGRVIVKFKCRKQIKNVLFTQNVFEKEKKTCKRACYKLSKL